MKKFLLKTLFFSTPIIILFLIETILPRNQFTYRPWETLTYNSKKGIAFPFIPNEEIAMISTGD